MKVLKNTSAKLLNQVILTVSSFVITIPLARRWGSELFGRYSFAIAFAGVFAFAFDWGLRWLLTREVARDRENVSRYVNNAFGLMTVFSSITLLLLVVLVHFLHYSREVALAVYLAGLWTFLEVVSLVFLMGAFYAIEKMEYETPALLAERGFATAFGLWVIFTDGGLVALLLVLVISKLIKVFVCAAIYVWKIDSNLGLEFDWPLWRRLARLTFPFGLDLAFGLIYTNQIDITLLSFLGGSESEIGYYRASLTLVAYLPLVAIALTTSLFPVMSDLYVSDRERFLRNYQRMIKYLFVLGLPMTVGLSLLGGQFMELVYGKEFGPAVASLRILSFSILLKFMHGALAMVLTASDRQELRTTVTGLAALANVALNLVLISWNGYVGASLATVLTDGVILVAFYLLVSDKVGRLPFSRLIVRPIMSGAVMGGYVVLLRELALIALVPSAAIIYIVVLYLLGGVPTEDLAGFRKAFLARHLG
jgi:O-antigen/teichoic acid export membrane protein